MRFLQIVGLGFVLCVFIAVVSAATSHEAERPRSGYFPGNRLRTDAQSDQSAEQWYSTVLADMDYPVNRAPPRSGPVAQPSIYKPSEAIASNETYRALISFGREYLMAVRVYRVQEGAYVVANQTDFRSEGRNRSTARQLTGDEWQELNRLLEGANFWNDQNRKAGYAGDCVDWVIEGRDDGRYNVVSMTCPPTPQLKALAEFFPRVAGWYPY